MVSPFLLALHADRATPRALALVERRDAGAGPAYVVRALRRLDASDPIADALSTLTSDPQYVARTVVVTTGGQAAADALRARGPSAAAVTLLDGTAAAGTDTQAATAGELANTFQRLYRAGAVDVPGSIDAGGDAVRALAAAADLDAAADDRDDTRLGDGDVDDATTTTLAGTTVPGTGPAPSTVVQSGGETAVSTHEVDPRVTEDVRSGRVASGAAGPADLGEHADVALALALAVWFGEATRDELPATDQADEVRRR